ncbi:GapS4a family protein [Yersinia wautersii]|uniref:GapS4a family protein n=1 Tax=Yersinia wautersii TaxID=1341643 RepID=UPI000416E9F5|nr:hypothetical protein [Yersinia wautersii]
MGEYSKLVGDIGESIVSNILHLLGWENHAANKYIDCHTKRHKKTTHGIDCLFVYESPLESGTVDNVLVSTKFSSSPYASINSTFKKHFEDISFALECYVRSPLKKEINDALNLSNGLRRNETGVLFYINNDPSPEGQNIVSKIQNVRLDPDLKFKTIHVIDNNIAGFLYDSISFVKNRYRNETVNFFYPQTSLNLTGNNKKYYGSILPVDYISSPIIPFFIDMGVHIQPKICLASSLELTKENLEYLISFVRDLVSDVSKDLLFLFPNYNYLLHKEIIDKVKMGVSRQDGVRLDIEVSSYNDNFRGSI